MRSSLLTTDDQAENFFAGFDEVYFIIKCNNDSILSYNNQNYSSKILANDQ